MVFFRFSTNNTKYGAYDGLCSAFLRYFRTKFTVQKYEISHRKYLNHTCIGRYPVQQVTHYEPRSFCK